MMCAKYLGTCTTDLRFIYHYLDNAEKSRIKCSFFQYKMVFLTETVSWYDAAINWHRKPPNYSSILDIILAKYDQLSPPYETKPEDRVFGCIKYRF